MMYQRQSFTVPASSSKSPPNCAHGWVDSRGKCVLCGAAFNGQCAVEVFGDADNVHIDRYAISSGSERFRRNHDATFRTPTETMPNAEIVPLRSSYVTE